MQAQAATLTQIPPPLFQGRRKDGVRWYVLGLLLAVGAHSVAGVSVHRLPASKPPVRVSMAVTRTEKPPPPPPEEKKPEPEKPPEKKPPKPEIAKAPPAPPPPNAPPPKQPPKPVPILSGVTLESTVQGPGNFQVAVGNTLFDDPNKNKSKPTEVQRYTAPVYREAPAPPKTGGVGKDMGVFKPVPKFSVSTEPEVLREVKAPYPPDARRDGIEGVVELRVELWEDGTVRSVKVVRSLNPSLDTAAVEAIRKFLFKPATVDGVAVQYVIPRYSFRFELQG